MKWDLATIMAAAFVGVFVGLTLAFGVTALLIIWGMTP